MAYDDGMGESLPYSHEPDLERGPATLDADPSMYKTVIVGDKKKVLDNLSQGFMLSISVNMDNYSIYIGSDHYNMQIDYNVPPRSLCAANVKWDRDTNRLKVINMADWRNDQRFTVDNPIVAAAVGERLTRDLIKSITKP